jgi:hypothetical protein
MEWLIGFLLLIVVCVAIVRGLGTSHSNSKRSLAAKISPDPLPPRADSCPYLKEKFLFSVAERSFYEILRRLAFDYTVFAKVRLADVVHVSKGSRAWQSDFDRISSKHLDFLLCDRNLAPVVAIEFDDTSHDEEDRQSRDDFVDQVLASAALPIIHVRAKRGYALDEVREMLRPYTRVLSPAEVVNGDARYMSLSGWRPAV